ncbi:MAG: response regulator [Proteobacteria bacterium]|nr:response regulator [Pseudomonadota bacterium]MBU1737572.1 response regulator [Pseudomonadota bacterium]
MMHRDKSSANKFMDLRKRAHAYLSIPIGNGRALSQEEVKKLVHELDTYQIELELQNEDLRKTQQELEQSRRKYTNLYDFAPVGYLTVSGTGLIVEANLTAADMLGVARGSLLRQPLSAFILEADQDIHYHCRKRLLESKKKQSCQFRCRKKDGTIFHAQLKSTVDFEMDGHTSRFRTIMTDITEQKKIEIAIQQGKREWEQTFDAMPDIVTLLDKDLRIFRANEAAHVFFKVQPGGLNGRHCHELFRKAASPCPDCPAVRTIENPLHSFTEIVEHPTLGKIFQLSSSPVLDENGELQYLVHTAKDISEIKRMEEDLFQSRKMEAMGTLAGGIAHDFNNILTAIMGYAELTKNSLSRSDLPEDHVDQILHAANRAKELVKQILTFSRKRQDSTKVQLQPQIIVKEALKMLRASLPTTTELKEDIDPECGDIMMDPSQFHQLLMNLYTNAFHALPEEQGTITIRLSNKILGAKEVSSEPEVSPGLFVELVVQDTGCGMEKQVLTRIFEPYYTTKGTGKGSGIGLAVVYGIVKSHGGLVKVESTVGKGSMFKLYFPAVEKRYKQKEAPEEKKALPTGTERILVVDDEEMISNFLKTCLTGLGYTVTAHTSSLQALADFNSRPDAFDLVVTDQTMPRMPGSDLSRKLLAARPDIPIIICTGYSSMISEKKAKELGIRKFVLKPVSMKDMANIVREVLDRN